MLICPASADELLSAWGLGNKPVVAVEMKDRKGAFGCKGGPEGLWLIGSRWGALEHLGMRGWAVYLSQTYFLVIEVPKDCSFFRKISCFELYHLKISCALLSVHFV